MLDTHLCGISTRKPSELMDEMLALLDEHDDTCFLFEQIFLRQLPEDIRLQLALGTFANPRELATLKLTNLCFRSRMKLLSVKLSNQLMLLKHLARKLTSQLMLSKHLRKGKPAPQPQSCVSSITNGGLQLRNASNPVVLYPSREMP